MKVMVIDDEPIVAKGLQKLVPWQEHGFEYIGSANNGQEALVLIEQLQPDLMIVDCKMPVMDGITLIQEIERRELPIKSIILSGHDEFSYAQQALKHGASDYFLKPPDLERLLEACIKLKQEKAEELRIKQQIKENIPVMIQRFLLSLIDTRKLSVEDFQNQSSYLNIPLQAGPFCIAVLEMFDTEDKLEGYSYEDYQLIYFAMANIMQETLNSWTKKAIVQDADQRFIMILNLRYHEDMEQLRVDLKQVIDNIQGTLKLSVAIGVSQYQSSLIHEGKKAYSEAKLAVQYKYYTGLNEVIYLEEIAWEKTAYIESGRNLLNLQDEALLLCLKVGDLDGMSAWVHSFIETLKQGVHSTQETKMMSVQYMLTACHTFIDIHPTIPMEQIFTAKDFKQVFQAETLDELRVLLQRFLSHLVYLSQDLRTSDKNIAVEKTKQYIAENFHLNLSLDSIAREVHLAPAYLSYLFKQVEFVTITEYLTTVRLEHAKELLQHTTHKANEISGMVGYLDNKYFSRLFKRNTGMTPIEYRQQFIQS